MRLAKPLHIGLCLGMTAALTGCGDDTQTPAAPEPVEMTIELVEHADNETVIHTEGNGGMEDTVGDLLVFANPVFDKANATQVATDQGSCVRTVVGKSFECEWTIFLNNGQITVTGPFNDVGNSELSITGGTGAFETARGEMHLGNERKPPPGKVEFDFVYHVTLDPE